MKTIKLNACIYNNVGDDLMVEVLLTRYPNYNFFYSGQYYTHSDKFSSHPNFLNLRTIYRRWGRINHLVNLLTFHKFNDCVFHWAQRRMEKSCIASVYIGGSIYIEKSQESVDERINREREKLKNGPLFVIGANFGPYKNPEFKEKFHQYFSECAGVCFREKESVCLFSNLPQINYAPDVVFNHSMVPSKANSNTVVISVIDFHNRSELSDYAQSYDRFICDVCRQCVLEGKTPILAAFCEQEGDYAAVETIYHLLEPATRAKTGKMFYGDMKQIITTFSEADFILATRFHAMILALKLKKPFFCVSYNQKIKNVLDDLESNSYCLPEQLGSIDVRTMLKTKEEILYLEEYIEQAVLQFKQLDEFLNRI